MLLRCDVSDEGQFRRLVVWLEDQKIRFASTFRFVLNNLCIEVFNTFTIPKAADY